MHFTKPVYFIAHRGLSGHNPENTHAAFNAAWEADCDGIELDIQVTKDGQVIAFHDATTKRMAGVEYVVKETNWEVLKALDVGKGGKGGSEQFVEQIPLLSDVVANMPTGKLIQIEIKKQVENMQAVIAILSQLREDISVQIISFDWDKLCRIRKDLPHLACLLVVDGKASTPDCIDSTANQVLIGIDMDHHTVTPEFVKSVLDKNLLMAYWTVNEVELARKLIANGARFLAGDFADELLVLR
ncbi:MAG: glycerophosphodiester phosphodiesterase [Ostreibacterium sp.]